MQYCTAVKYLEQDTFLIIMSFLMIHDHKNNFVQMS